MATTQDPTPTEPAGDRPIASVPLIGEDDLNRAVEQGRADAAKFAATHEACDILDWANLQHPDMMRRAEAEKNLRMAGVEHAEASRMAAEWIGAPDDTGEDLVQTFAELEADDGALSEVLFPALAYRSRAVLAFGHRGQSKTTVCTWAARELSRAGLKVLVVGGDDPHTWLAALPRMGAFLQNVSYARAADMARPGVLEDWVERKGPFDWIVVDNWRTWGLATDGQFDFNGDTAVGSAAGRLVALTDDDGPGVTIIANTGHHDESRSKGSAALEEAVHATRKVILDGDLSIIEPTPNTKTREGIDRDTVTLRARLDAAGRPEAYWLESRGPGVPTPDHDGTPPKGWTSKHAAFLDAWRGEHPTGSARALASALKEADLGVRWQTARERFKSASSESGTHRDSPGPTLPPCNAEGGSVGPDTRRDPGTHPQRGESGVSPESEPMPAVYEGAGVESQGGIETMTNAERAAIQADTAAMVDDWAAGGEQAYARMRANAIQGLNATIPDWQERATALGLDGDLMKWTDADWAAVAAPAPAPEPDGMVRWSAPGMGDHVANPAALMQASPDLRRHCLARLPAEFVAVLKGHGVAA